MMKLTVIALILALLLSSAWSQSVPPLFSPPYAGPLIDDTDIFNEPVPAKQISRFEIVQIQGEAILLDSAKGDTWQLVALKTDGHTQLHWKPICKLTLGDERCCSCCPGTEEAVPADKEPFDPFRENE